MRPIVIVSGYGPDAVLEVGTVGVLAARLDSHQRYGDGEVGVTEVHALNQLGELKPINWDVKGAGDFDEKGRAYPQVFVTFPDGGRQSAHYMIDGNA